MPSSASFFDSQTTDGTGNIWLNTVNVEASDDADATTTFIAASFTVSRILHVFNFFNFSVPNSARLLGIEVNIEWEDDVANVEADIIRLEQNQVIIPGSLNRTLANLPNIETIDTFGSPTDVWNTGFTHIGDLAPAGGTISDFGIGLRFTDGVNAGLVRIDAVECVIHWQPTFSGARHSRSYYRSPRKRRLGAHPAGF